MNAQLNVGLMRPSFLSYVPAKGRSIRLSNIHIFFCFFENLFTRLYVVLKKEKYENGGYTKRYLVSFFSFLRERKKLKQVSENH